MDDLKPPAKLDLCTYGPTTIVERWQRYKKTMRLFIELAMADKSEKEKCSAFLYTIGQAGLDVYNTMRLTEEETNKIDILFSKFDAYRKPKQNVMIKRYCFYMRAQSKEESIDQYVVKLQLLAKNCGFGSLEDQLIRDRIVCGTYSEDVRQRLLRIDDLSLEKAISICQADAESKKSSQYIAETTAEVYGLKQKSGNRDNPPVKSTRKFSEELTQPRRVCGSCGLMHPRKQCPAFIKRCLRCKKPNHFAKYCRSVPHRTDAVEQTEQAGDSESDELLFIDTIKSSTEITDCDCFTMLNIEGTSIRFKVDTGSQVNILPSSLYHT